MGTPVKKRSENDRSTSGSPAKARARDRSRMLSQARQVLPPWMDLRLYIAPGRESKAVYWRINGFRARLLVWTVAEWEKLEPRPTDAQYHPSGVWCALRLD